MSRLKARHNLCRKSISGEEGDENAASVKMFVEIMDDLRNFCGFSRQFEVQLRREKKAILAHTCPSHPAQLHVTLTNLKVKFLPKKTMSKLQTCNMGIMANLRRHYQKPVISRLLHNIDTNMDMGWKSNLLKAIHMTTTARNQVLPETTTECF